MSLWVVIPVKPLRLGKSRLSGVLPDADRENLNKNLLVQTIQCTQSISKIAETVVISCDPAALRLSREFGVRTIREGHCTNINNALRKATSAIRSFHVDQLLVLPADLPFLCSDDLSQLIQKIKSPPEIIITPDRNKNGTNVLLIHPVGILDYDFGNWSFRKHIEQAERKKIRVEIYNNENLAFDLDTPNDMEYLKQENILGQLLMSRQSR